MSRLSLSPRLIFLLALALASLGHLRAADPLSEQECQEFGRQFAGLCRKNIIFDLEKLWDYDALADTTLKGLELNEAQRKTARDDYEELFQDLWPQTLRLDPKRTFYYSGTLIHDNRQCVVIDWAKGLSCDLYLVAIARAADGKLKCTDIYNVSDAAWESEMRRNRVLSRLPKEVLMRQPADVLQPLRATSALKNITDSIATDKPEEAATKREQALEKIAERSEKFRSQKPVLRTAALLAGSVSNKDKFRAEIEHWKNLYPTDMSPHFHAYLGYLQFGDNEAAILELQALKKKAGINPYLQFLLGYHFYELGNLGEAKKAAVTATLEGIRTDPIIYDWDLLLKVSAKEKDYPELVRLLGKITEVFPSIQIRNVIDSGISFQEFRQSEEYRQWIAGSQPAHN